MSDQKGSVTVVIVFLLPVMLLMVALIVNINQLVFAKIRLQNTVDACALSAAAVQAAGLNEIADLNHEMALERDMIGRMLQRRTWRDYSQARAARDFFYNGNSGVIDNIRRYQQRANVYYALRAEDVAHHVKELNLPQGELRSRNNTGRLTSMDYRHVSTSFMYYTQSYPYGYPVAASVWVNPGSRSHADNRNGLRVAYVNRIAPFQSSFTMPERGVKLSPTYVDYEIILPSGTFAVAGGIFGPLPALRARAVSKPSGGNIYRGNATYEAVLVR